MRVHYGECIVIDFHKMMVLDTVCNLKLFICRFIVLITS